MLIQHSGSLAGGHREGIHSFTAPRKREREKKKKNTILHSVEWRKGGKHWSFGIKKKSHTLTYFLFRYILQDGFTFRWQLCRDVLQWKKKKTIITWGRNINTWCSQAGREFNEQEQEKSERCRYKLEKMWGLQRREKKDASRECGL